MSHSFSKPSSSRSNSVFNNDYPENRPQGRDAWAPLLQRNAAILQHETDALSQQFSRSSPRQNRPSVSNSSVPRAPNTVLRAELFSPRLQNVDSNNNISTPQSNEIVPKRSSKSTTTKSRSRRGASSSRSTSFEQKSRNVSSPSPSDRPSTSRSSAIRVSTAPPKLEQPQSSSSSFATPRKKSDQHDLTTGTRSPRRRSADPRLFVLSDSPRSRATDSAAEAKDNPNSTFGNDVQVVFPRRRKSSKYSNTGNSSTSMSVGATSGVGAGARKPSSSRASRKHDEDRSVNNHIKRSKSPSASTSGGGNSSRRSKGSHRRTQTAPPLMEQRHTPRNASKTEIIVPGCLKRSDRTTGTNTRVRCDLQISRSVKQAVTFAPDTVNVNRESKPKKQARMKNNRKPKWAHVCCQHFLPPIAEIIQVLGMDSMTRRSTPLENPYTKFYTIWCGPMGRVSKESVVKKAVRVKRFRNLLSALSISHESFNSVEGNKKKALLMTEEILPRYIAALDIALMDGELDHVEQLLSTIISSLTVLQINLHDIYFHKNGKPRDIPQRGDDYFVDVGPIIFTMNRIIGDQNGDLPIESHLAKLQLELLVLCFCPFDCLIFRSQLAVIPSSARMALDSLKEVRKRRIYYSVRWVNDSVMHRDYMSLLKFFGFCDETGAKNPVPLPSHGGPRIDTTVSSSSLSDDWKTAGNNGQRPASAEPAIMAKSFSHSNFRFSS